MNCLNRFHSNTFVVAAAAAIFLLNWAPRSAAPNARPHQQQQQLEPAVPNYCNDSQLMQQAGLIRAPMGQFLGFPCSSEFFHCRWQNDGYRTYRKNCRTGLVYDVLGTQNCNYDYNVKGCALSPTGWKAKCGLHDFACPQSEDCVALDKRCDGAYDCTLEEDEQNCPMCRAGEFPCVVKEQCVPMGARCDGVRDCDDGTDELDCDGCGKGNFLCRKSGKCIAGRERCDGVKQCPHGDDEFLCKKGGGVNTLPRSILSATIPRAKSSVLMALNSPITPSVPPPKSHPNSATEVRLQNHSSALTSDSHSQSSLQKVMAQEAPPTERQAIKAVQHSKPQPQTPFYGPLELPSTLNVVNSPLLPPAHNSVGDSKSELAKIASALSIPSSVGKETPMRNRFATPTGGGRTEASESFEEPAFSFKPVTGTPFSTDLDGTNMSTKPANNPSPATTKRDSDDKSVKCEDDDEFSRFLREKTPELTETQRKRLLEFGRNVLRKASTTTKCPSQLRKTSTATTTSDQQMTEFDSVETAEANGSSKAMEQLQQQHSTPSHQRHSPPKWTVLVAGENEVNEAQRRLPALDEEAEASAQFVEPPQVFFDPAPATMNESATTSSLSEQMKSLFSTIDDDSAGPTRSELEQKLLQWQRSQSQRNKRLPLRSPLMTDADVVPLLLQQRLDDSTNGSSNAAVAPFPLVGFPISRSTTTTTTMTTTTPNNSSSTEKQQQQQQNLLKQKIMMKGENEDSTEFQPDEQMAPTTISTASNAKNLMEQSEQKQLDTAKSLDAPNENTKQQSEGTSNEFKQLKAMGTKMLELSSTEDRSEQQQNDEQATTLRMAAVTTTATTPTTTTKESDTSSSETATTTTTASSSEDNNGELITSTAFSSSKNEDSTSFNSSVVKLKPITTTSKPSTSTISATDPLTHICGGGGNQSKDVPTPTSTDSEQRKSNNKGLEVENTLTGENNCTTAMEATDADVEESVAKSKAVLSAEQEQQQKYQPEQKHSSSGGIVFGVRHGTGVSPTGGYGHLGRAGAFREQSDGDETEAAAADVQEAEQQPQQQIGEQEQTTDQLESDGMHSAEVITSAPISGGEQVAESSSQAFTDKQIPEETATEQALTTHSQFGVTSTPLPPSGGEVVITEERVKDSSSGAVGTNRLAGETGTSEERFGAADHQAYGGARGGVTAYNIDGSEAITGSNVGGGYSSAFSGISGYDQLKKDSPSMAVPESSAAQNQPASDSAEDLEILHRLSNKYGTTARDLLLKVENLLVLTEEEEARREQIGAHLHPVQRSISLPQNDSAIVGKLERIKDVWAQLLNTNNTKPNPNPNNNKNNNDDDDDYIGTVSKRSAE